MTVATILTELPRLTPAELARVQAKVDELVGTALVYSPRLTGRTRAAELVKRVVDTDDSVARASRP